MSIAINPCYTGAGGGARAFVREMEEGGTAGRIRAETGNERCACFQPPDDPETVLLTDAWSDQTAPDRHHAFPMMENITRLWEKYALHMRAERYVTDTGGDPAANEKFIRK